MSEKRDSSQGPIRPSVSQQDPKNFNEAPNQKEEQQWRERQQNNPMKQQAERDREREQQRDEEE